MGKKQLKQRIKELEQENKYLYDILSSKQHTTCPITIYRSWNNWHDISPYDYSKWMCLS